MSDLAKQGVEIESKEVDNLERARRFVRCAPREWGAHASTFGWVAVDFEFNDEDQERAWYFNKPDTHPGNGDFFMWLVQQAWNADYYCKMEDVVCGGRYVYLADSETPWHDPAYNNSRVAALVECYCQLREQALPNPQEKPEDLSQTKTEDL